VATLGQRIARRLSLEVRTGHVVEEQVVVQRKQLAEAGDQVLLQRRLVGQLRIPAILIAQSDRS